MEEFLSPSHYNTYFYYISLTDLQMDARDTRSIKLIERNKSSLLLQIVDESTSTQSEGMYFRIEILGGGADASDFGLNGDITFEKMEPSPIKNVIDST